MPSVTDLDARTIGDTIDVLLGKRETVRTYSTGRVEYNLHAREAYSYGRHFPLFHYVPRQGRRPALFVINGDVWRQIGPTRTPDHQIATRNHIAATGIASIVIPFSALDGAGIDLDSIRPIHVRDDAQWDEERTAETIDGVPRWLRTVRYSLDCTAETIEDVPPSFRKEHRPETDSERAEAKERYGYSNGWVYADRLPADDGLYHWTETRERPKAPDSDGLYRWSVTIHRLGDSLFSAERNETVTGRPFPGERANAIATAEDRANGNPWRTVETCDDNPFAPGDGTGAFHCADENGARCVFCNRELAPVTETVRRRARYLSSFDINETPPLYFLAEVPRGAGNTVESAIDALAPPAVWAARARGKKVERHGDIFFIETSLTLDELESRGIRDRARLTMVTRNAKSRKGETGYVKPLDAAGRRKFNAYRARRYREIRAQQWALVADGRGAPVSNRGARRRYREIRAKHAAAVARLQSDLRRAILAPTYRDGDRIYGRSAVESRRLTHVQQVKRARQSLDYLERTGGTDANGFATIAEARDLYRKQYGANAQSAWIKAHGDAVDRFTPARNEKMRERILRAVAIYGTAHAATESVTLRNGAQYVRGTVRHVPDLEPGRTGAPDHAPLFLGDGNRWYLAVRNTVPRQVSRRRRRNRTATVSR